MSVTTSRTPFVFFILAYIMLFIYIFMHRKKHENKLINKKIILLITSLFFGLLVIEFFLPKIFNLFTDRTDVTSGLYRFDSSVVGQSTYRRFYEWYKDIVIFINHPPVRRVGIR